MGIYIGLNVAKLVNNTQGLKSLWLPKFMEKEGGARHGSNLTHLLPCFMVIIQVGKKNVVSIHGTRGGAVHRVILEENDFYLYKMYILNVLGSKNMYRVLVW